MLFAAIGTKISSPGPILFKQQRIGKLGKSFTMLKFRSMVVNDSQDNTWSSSGDARITKFGSFLRRTAIDELPQFFNVLAGHMSLVGPRPEIPVFVEQFRETVPLYMIKHYVRPGVTGLAQIKGLRGDTSLEDRIHEDIAYLENWSLMLDFAILLKTPFKAFNKSERYMGDVKIGINSSNENNDGGTEHSDFFVTDIITEAPIEQVTDTDDEASAEKCTVPKDQKADVTICSEPAVEEATNGSNENDSSEIITKSEAHTDE
jgi:lipopolysaccharide/colanic/teichoic acid biosynthesis glycosyltransferase